MFNHAPKNFACPFCLVAAGGQDRYNGPGDVVYATEFVTAFISPKWWVNNPGHVLVVPNAHFENIYDITDDALAQVYMVAKRVAVAMKQAYGCDGTSMRQHNEPAGGQDMWHFHVHVFPRYQGDQLYKNDDQTRFVGAEEKREYAEKLRRALTQ
jgi:histidine triad (HIT) family protein